jgi:hypothetical protein
MEEVSPDSRRVFGNEKSTSSGVYKNVKPGPQMVIRINCESTVDLPDANPVESPLAVPVMYA